MEATEQGMGKGLQATHLDFYRRETLPGLPWAPFIAFPPRVVAHSRYSFERPAGTRGTGLTCMGGVAPGWVPSG